MCYRLVLVTVRLVTELLSVIAQVMHRHNVTRHYRAMYRHVLPCTVLEFNRTVNKKLLTILNVFYSPDRLVSTHKTQVACTKVVRFRYKNVPATL